MAKLKKVEPTQLTPRREAERAPARYTDPFEEMERLFEGFFGRGLPRMFSPWEMSPWAGGAQVRMPRVDIIDKDEQVLIRAEMPGVRKEDLDVSVVGNTLTIRGISTHEEKEERGDYYRSEMSRGEFSRTVTLPADVDETNSSAKLENGILELHMPKRAKRRSIKVQ